MAEKEPSAPATAVESESGARRAATEQAIVESARDILADRGMEALSMRSVAERVGVSATAIYHYFENKEELVGRVVRQGFQEFGEFLQSEADRYRRGSLERVRAIGHGYIAFALEHQAYFRVLFGLHHQHPHALEDLPEDGGYRLLKQAVQDAMEAGTMRRVDADLMVMYLWSVTHGLLTISLACRLGRGPVELFAAFAPLVREGIASTDARNQPVEDDEEGIA
ncbi:MAG: TetR/AcrR family transcriptional regulator [Gemmatimonadales bacterium]|jgi:AcrR family transcriptional regulator